MEYELVVRAAHPGLRRHLDRYWGYAQQTAQPVRQREPLQTGAILIFGLGTELRVIDRAGAAPARRGSFVAGLDDACAVIEHDGELRGIQVDLTPLAVRMLFREPMHAFARTTVTLEDLLGREGLRLDERLGEARTWDERFELVEQALATRLAAAEPPPADVEWAWRRLTTSRGRVRVSDLAAELGCSRKHLAARFREHVGLPPKLVARMLRFRHASDLLSSELPPPLAELARACGYYDQAHLDRDFRAFASTTPTAFLDDRVTFVQDTASAAA